MRNQPLAGITGRKEAPMATILHPQFGQVTVDLGNEYFRFVTPNTQCCGSAASGIEDYVGCKECLQPVPEWFGSCARTIEELMATI
jgi:hypothetical protein